MTEPSLCNRHASQRGAVGKDVANAFAILRGLIRHDELKIVGAEYSIESGEVDFTRMTKQTICCIVFRSSTIIILNNHHEDSI